MHVDVNSIVNKETNVTVEIVVKFDHKPRADDLLTVRYYINNAVTNH